MNGDDILLYKPISHPGDYSGLQTDISAIQDCISTNYTESRQTFKKGTSPSTSYWVRITLEQAESYRYLGVLVTLRLTWSDRIEQIFQSTKTRKLAGILYRQFLAGMTPTPYCSIVHHLEYACQCWDPFSNKDMRWLEAVQKFACKICLKQWDLDYDNVAAVQPPLFVSST